MRWILGASALLAGMAAPLPRGWRLGLLGFAATEFITAATQYCPVNRALRINTNRGDIENAVQTATEVARKIAA